MAKEMGLRGDRPILLWDIDGTLVESTGRGEDKHRLAVEKAIGRPLQSAGNSSGWTDLQIVLHLLRDSGHSATPSLVENILAELNTLSGLDIEAGSISAKAGVFETLHQVDSLGWKNGLVTGNTAFRAQRKLSAAGLLAFFVGSPGFFGEMHSDRFSLVSEVKDFLAGASVLSAVIIGDTPLDVQAASIFGLPSIAVAAGSYSFQELATHSPSLVVQDLVEGRNELLAWLEENSAG